MSDDFVDDTDENPDFHPSNPDRKRPFSFLGPQKSLDFSKPSTSTYTSLSPPQHRYIDLWYRSAWTQQAYSFCCIASGATSQSQTVLLIGLELGVVIFPYIGLGLEMDPEEAALGLEEGLGPEVGRAWQNLDLQHNGAHKVATGKK